MLCKLCRRFLFVLFFEADLPLKQEGHACAEEDDSAENEYLAPLADDYRAEQLSAHFKLDGKGDTLHEVKTHMVFMTNGFDNTADYRYNKNTHADTFNDKGEIILL